MRKLYKALFVVAISLVSAKGFSQQDPQYTQYMYNMNVVNPAYAGSKENLSIGLLYRDQWSGFEGAPKTFTLYSVPSSNLTRISSAPLIT